MWTALRGNTRSLLQAMTGALLDTQPCIVVAIIGLVVSGSIECFVLCIQRVQRTLHVQCKLFPSLYKLGWPSPLRCQRTAQQSTCACVCTV